jgi:putative DNA primase/helicase
MILADRAETRNEEILFEREVDFPTLNVLNPSETLALNEPPLPFQDAGFQLPTPDVADAEPRVRTLDFSWQEPLNEQVATWLRLFVEDGQVVELRALNVAMNNGAKVTYSGFYSSDKLDEMAKAAVYLTPEAEGVYFTLNPLEKSLLARRYNKVEPAKDTAADADVVQRRWLLVDADPVRKSGISASNREKQQAWETIRQVHRWLQAQGWPEPVLADSGNGYHLLYRMDLPSEDDGRVKSVLETLAARFDSGRVKIDTKVFNPSRIVKLYGTVARKGDSIQERPHRRTGVLAIPDELIAVDPVRLEAVGGQRVPKKEAPVASNPVVSEDRSWLLLRARRYLEKVTPAISGQGGHNQTFKVACILRQRFQLSEEEALSVIGPWNETCQPPWTEKDLRKKLKDAAERAGRQPNLLPRADSTEMQEEAFELPETREAPDDPHRLAQLFLRNSSAEEGRSTVRYWNGDWYQWDGLAYRLLSEGEMRAGLTRSIKREFDRLNLLERLGPVLSTTEEQLAREPNVRRVTTKLVTDVLQALRPETFLSGSAEPPAWLGSDEPFPAKKALVATNGIIHLPSLLSGEDYRQAPTPRLFTTVALDYEISREASSPSAWLSFLDALWPGDAESVQLLQEWFGYCLTQDTSQQKMLMVVGPKRAGKGTIARVLTALVGPVNVAGPTLGSLASNFGLSQLLGKPVAIISDARFSGRSADQSVVVERLLSISGEDTLTIDRKNRAHVTVKLPCRFTILTNELPRLNDASAALPSRLLVLQLTRSWYGQEDTQLVETLLKERGGIFLWALEGLRRLRARGRFLQPASGTETARRMVELSSPVTAFVLERCELGADQTIAKRTLFELWRLWCNESGHEAGSVATFGRNLLAAFPEIQSARPREGGGRINNYSGIGLAKL